MLMNGSVRRAIAIIGRQPLAVVRFIRKSMESAAISRLAARARPRVGQSDIRSFPLGPAVSLTAYRIDRPGFVGPAASVYWRDQELLRLDLQHVTPHVHYAFAQSKLWGGGGTRIYLLPMTIEEQADFGAFQIEHNLSWCFANHPDRRVNHSLPRPDGLRGAAQWLREQILDLHRANRH